MLRFDHLEPHEIANYLEGFADEITDGNVFYRPITQEEKFSHLEDFAAKSSEIQDLEETMKAQVAAMKADIAARKLEANEVLHTIQTGKEKKTGKLFVVRDEDLRTITAYDSTGAVIESRSMRMTETQRIIPFSKKASNE